MAEIFLRFNQYPTFGVWPLGAQVRLTFGMSKKPLSSRKIRCAPNRSAFFNLGPGVALPMGNGFFVPLQWTAFRLLATPAKLIQNLPQVARMVVNPKAGFDEFGNPLQRP